jgi:predicted XRE-type DNA-binding protein
MSKRSGPLTAKRQATLRRRIGEQLRTAREASDVTQAQIDDLFGWRRDMMSKVEAGKVNLSTADYLIIVDHLREHMPEAPVALLKAVTPPS